MFDTCFTIFLISIRRRFYRAPILLFKQFYPKSALRIDCLKPGLAENELSNLIGNVDFRHMFYHFSNFHTAPVLPRSDITLQAVLSKICSTSHLSQLGPRRVKIWSPKITLRRQETESWVTIFNFSDFSKLGIFGGHGADLFVNTAPATEKLRSSRFAWTYLWTPMIVCNQGLRKTNCEISSKIFDFRHNVLLFV